MLKTSFNIESYFDINNKLLNMNTRDPKLTALMFNECINSQDLEGLIDLMAEDHKFIDSENKVENRKQMEIGWKEFFEAYPDYRNYFQKVISKNNLVILLGHSVCVYDPLDGPAIWTAKIENDKVAEWRIYEDTKENRKKLKIS